MTARNLEYLFRPKSVALVAEENDTDRYVNTMRNNLADGGFGGPLASIGVHRRKRFAIGTRLRFDAIDAPPDLAIVCASLDLVPSIASHLGALGTRALVVGPTPLARLDAEHVRGIQKAILDAARPHLMRVLGPGSAGIVVPALGLNASMAAHFAACGKIALVTQSASIAAAVMDRAHSQGIGFSAVVHLGACADIDLADVLDWLAGDPGTESLLVQFDAVVAGRKFMSAARAAARNKLVVAIRCKRAASAPDAEVSRDELYEAALRRAGWVIIDSLADLFEATEAMARARPMRGERLCIVGNGHGVAQIAFEALQRTGGTLATLDKESTRRIEEVLAHPIKRFNPLALPANVLPAQWAAALATLLADKGNDAVLTVCSPSPFATGSEVAEALCAAARDSERNVFTCWVGGASMQDAQRIAGRHGVLNHASVESAIAVFQGILSFQRNRRLLMQMPATLAEDFVPDSELSHGVLDDALAAGFATLPTIAARRLLHAYGIDFAEYAHAGSIDSAVRAADAIGYPVDLFLCTSGAPELDLAATALRSSADIHVAASGLRRDARARHAGVRMNGYRLRPSAPRSGACALRVGVFEDAVFGPVIHLGPSLHGGCLACRNVVGLPPLNQVLAADLVARSGFAHDAPEEQRAQLEATASALLVRVSQLLTDLDEVAGIELDPMHIEPSGARAFDVRIHVARRGRKLGHRRFAICPYPKEVERTVDWNGRALLIRPIRPEDETTLGDLLGSLAPEDARMRFFDTMRRLPRSQLARFTQIDYDREMALVAIERDADGSERSLGEVRLVTAPDNVYADFAIVVRSELKGQGLGRVLLTSIVDYARTRGIGELRAETLSSNMRMQKLATDLGFTLSSGAEWGTIDLRLPLKPAAAPHR